jgi:hypothetical protein
MMFGRLEDADTRTRTRLGLGVMDLVESRIYCGCA